MKAQERSTYEEDSSSCKDKLDNLHSDTVMGVVGFAGSYAN